MCGCGYDTKGLQAIFSLHVHYSRVASLLHTTKVHIHHEEIVICL